MILPLTANGVNLANSGGKGANLGVMVRAGWPVPAGFIITTDAYRQFMAINQFAPFLEQVNQTTNPTNPDSYEQASAVIRARFEQGSVPADLVTMMMQAYANLLNGKQFGVAVRSSATAEDLPEASFAGQQESYLNIGNETGLLQAVKRCWASLWTARAMAYRARQQLGPDEVALAIVVQQMVAAEVAGVMFTVNPVTGHRGEVVINATWGLGEALVAGQVNPDTLVVDKDTGRIKQLTIADKAIMTAPTPAGTHEIGVEADRRQQASLSESQASRLAQWAGQIEAHFARPQDIEWAIANDQIFILQSRPVTTLPPPPLDSPPPGDDNWLPLNDYPIQPFDLWSQADVGERWPEPVTPLTWSTAFHIVSQNMRDAFGELKAPYLAQIRWVRRQYGRVYLNEGGMNHILSHEYGMPASSIAAGLGTQGDVPAGQDQWQWGIVLRRLPLFAKIFIKWGRDIKRFENLFPVYDRWVEQFMAEDLSPLSDLALWEAAQKKWYDRAMAAMVYHAEMTSMSSNYLSMLERVVERWLGDKKVAHRLISGLDGVIAAEMVPMLGQMADRLRQLGLAELVLGHDPQTALSLLRQSPAATPFWPLFNRFLERHGHRCLTEAEWRYPRWREAPHLVLEALAGYLTNPEQSAPAGERGVELAKHLEKSLKPYQSGYFRWLVAQTQQLMRMRDNGQNYLVKLILPIRHLYGQLAERWAGRGWLTQADDFFFLLAGEIEAVLAAGSPAGQTLQAIVDGRRQAYDYWFQIAIPEVLDKNGQPMKATLLEADEGALRGLPASPGRVTGRARIILNPREAGMIRPGEILVTRATDPGWTPVFSVVGGIVLEVGGLLSHGAIVAREYGLPAVVNVPSATRRIQDGQLITVDGSVGKIMLGEG